MISRAMLGLAATLVVAPFGSAALASDRLEAAPSAYAPYRYSARAYRGYGMHRGFYGSRFAHQRLHAARMWAPRHRWYAHGRSYGYRRAYYAPYGAYHAAVSYRPAYARPVSGSYLGGGLIGALFNQPACACW